MNKIDLNDNFSMLSPPQYVRLWWEGVAANYRQQYFFLVLSFTLVLNLYGCALKAVLKKSNDEIYS